MTFSECWGGIKAPTSLPSNYVEGRSPVPHKSPPAPMHDGPMLSSWRYVAEAFMSITTTNAHRFQSLTERCDERMIDWSACRFFRPWERISFRRRLPAPPGQVITAMSAYYKCTSERVTTFAVSPPQKLTQLLSCGRMYSDRDARLKFRGFLPFIASTTISLSSSPSKLARVFPAANSSAGRPTGRSFQVQNRQASVTPSRARAKV